MRPCSRQTGEQMVSNAGRGYDGRKITLKQGLHALVSFQCREKLFPDGISACTRDELGTEMRGLVFGMDYDGLHHKVKGIGKIYL